VSGARWWLVRVGRPRGELLVHLTGKLTRGPAGQIPGLIRWLAAAAEGYRRAQKRRTRVFAGAIRRWFGQLDLLKRTWLQRTRLERDLLDRHLTDRDLWQLCLWQLCLLRRDLLSALCAFIAVEEFG
jgi:hypothetical protein